MISKWFRKRKLDKFLANGHSWDYQLHNQDILETYNGKELSSAKMDDIVIMSKCGTVEKLVQVLENYLLAMEGSTVIPRVNGVSGDKGEHTLTNYLTSKNGYPYKVADADSTLVELLQRISTLLDNVKEEETQYSYYRRVLKPYVTEAIDFRITIFNETR